MGKANVCVSGPYEGLFFIDMDYTDVYRRSGSYEDETRLLKDLDSSDLSGSEWVFDEYGSAEELEDVLECFMSSFTEKFPSFERAPINTWLDRDTRVILENQLFYVGVEDNEWSEAVKLLQKDDEGLNGLQRKHHKAYLNGMARALLERLPEIGTYVGPYTSGRLTH